MGVQYCFLFDECLTPTLRSVAHEFGHFGFPVTHLDREGESDESLAILAVDRDYVVVTNNRIDFKRIYKRFDLHAGLVVIIPSVARDEQCTLFAKVLVALSPLSDIVNKLVEVDSEGRVTFTDWPPPLSNTPEI
jgi:hypothetical protein